MFQYAAIGLLTGAYGGKFSEKMSKALLDPEGGLIGTLRPGVQILTIFILQI